MTENTERRAEATSGGPDPTAVRLRIPPDAAIDATLEEKRAHAVSRPMPVAARLQQLARALSATHHRLRTFEPTMDRELSQDLAFYRQELERADMRSGDVDLKDRAKADARRRKVEERVNELREKEQRRQETIRESLLRALTSAAS